MKIQYTNQFKKDYKRIQKQGKDLEKLRSIIEKLSSNQLLEPQYRDHPLIGNWRGYRDCHIESDWILIYKITTDTLILARTGSHSDLFKN